MLAAVKTELDAPNHINPLYDRPSGSTISRELHDFIYESSPSTSPEPAPSFAQPKLSGPRFSVEESEFIVNEVMRRRELIMEGKFKNEKQKKEQAWASVWTAFQSNFGRDVPLDAVRTHWFYRLKSVQDAVGDSKSRFLADKFTKAGDQRISSLLRFTKRKRKPPSEWDAALAGIVSGSDKDAEATTVSALSANLPLRDSTGPKRRLKSRSQRNLEYESLMPTSTTDSILAALNSQIFDNPPPVEPPPVEPPAETSGPPSATATAVVKEEIMDEEDYAAATAPVEPTVSVPVASPVKQPSISSLKATPTELMEHMFSLQTAMRQEQLEFQREMREQMKAMKNQLNSLQTTVVGMEASQRLGVNCRCQCQHK